MPLQRRDNEDLCTFPPHPERNQLKREGLARAAGAEQNHICILIGSAVEDVHDHETVVVLVHAEQDSVFIRHLITGERISTGSCRGKKIPLAALKNALVDPAEGEDRQKGLFLIEPAQAQIHVLRHYQTAQLSDPPFQILQSVCSDRYQGVHVVKILVICQAFFQEITGLDCSFKVVEIRVGVRCVLDTAPIDSDLLTEFGLDTLLRFTLKEKVDVNSFACVYQKACPAGCHFGVIAVRRDHEISVINTVHNDVGAVCQVNAFRCQGLSEPERSLTVFRNRLNLPDAVLKGLDFAR